MRKTRFKNHRSDQSRGVDLFPGNPSNNSYFLLCLNTDTLDLLLDIINKERRDKKNQTRLHFFYLCLSRINSLTQFCLPSVVSNEQLGKSSDWRKGTWNDLQPPVLRFLVSCPTERYKDESYLNTCHEEREPLDILMYTRDGGQGQWSCKNILVSFT